MGKSDGDPGRRYSAEANRRSRRYSRPGENAVDEQRGMHRFKSITRDSRGHHHRQRKEGERRLGNQKVAGTEHGPAEPEELVEEPTRRRISPLESQHSGGSPAQGKDLGDHDTRRSNFRKGTRKPAPLRGFCPGRSETGHQTRRETKYFLPPRSMSPRECWAPKSWEKRCTTCPPWTKTSRNIFRNKVSAPRTALRNSAN